MGRSSSSRASDTEVRAGREKAKKEEAQTENKEILFPHFLSPSFAPRLIPSHSKRHQLPLGKDLSSKCN